MCGKVSSWVLCEKLLCDIWLCLRYTTLFIGVLYILTFCSALSFRDFVAEVILCRMTGS